MWVAYDDDSDYEDGGGGNPDHGDEDDDDDDDDVDAVADADDDDDVHHLRIAMIMTTMFPTVHRRGPRKVSEDTPGKLLKSFARTSETMFPERLPGTSMANIPRSVAVMSVS